MRASKILCSANHNTSKRQVRARRTTRTQTAHLFINIEKYPEVQTWLKTVSPKTAENYKSNLKKFCYWCGKTPPQLIIDRDSEKNVADPNKRTGTKNLILDFRVFLEREGYAPKSINAMDGAIRGFFTAVLGREGMINVGNYPDREVSKTKDLVPTLEEVKRMIDVSDISVKFSIIFLAQTGMRPDDALKLRVGDVQRELDLGKCPLAITFLPEKDRNRNIGERITFLGKDGIDILKQYLDWRRSGETITPDSPLFVGRSKKYNGKSIEALKKLMMNLRIQEAAERGGVGNGNGKYGRMRAYCLRKFFITQMTNHGVEDKIVNFLTCHKISSVDLVYWSRRVEELREIYRRREKYLNPVSGTQSRPSPEEIDQKIEAKLKVFIQSQELKEAFLKMLKENGNETCESKIVTSEEELIQLSNKGYDCQIIGTDKWLMRRHC
jgi:integrase